jgi:multiple sugar transport system permease protein/raffinose/stachyose/melibiose transport system permease protein
MTDGGPGDATRTVMYHIVQTGKTRQNIGPASAMSVVFFLIILVIALIQRRVLRSNEVV